MSDNILEFLPVVRFVLGFMLCGLMIFFLTQVERLLQPGATRGGGGAAVTCAMVAGLCVCATLAYLSFGGTF